MIRISFYGDADRFIFEAGAEGVAVADEDVLFLEGLAELGCLGCGESGEDKICHAGDDFDLGDGAEILGDDLTVFGGFGGHFGVVGLSLEGFDSGELGDESDVPGGCAFFELRDELGIHDEVSDSESAEAVELGH